MSRTVEKDKGMSPGWEDRVWQPSEENQVKGVERVYRSQISGLWVIENQVFEDERGWFGERGRQSLIEAAVGREFKSRQWNVSQTNQVGAWRGFHEEGQDKLVSVVAGQALAILVDVDLESSTLGRVEYVPLVAPGRTQGGLRSLFLEAGKVANGFLVLEAPLIYIYAVSQEYGSWDKEMELALDVFDPHLGIGLTLGAEEVMGQGLISARDTARSFGGRALGWREFMQIRQERRGRSLCD